MTIFIVFIVLIFIALVVNAVKEEEIKSNDRTQLQKIYEEKLKNRLTALYVFCGILALGILLYCFGNLNKDVQVDTWLFGQITRRRWTGTHYLAFFCTLIGAMGIIISAIKAHNANYYAKEYRTMGDIEYARKKQEIIDREKELESVPMANENSVANEEQPGLLSIFETPPPCPRCGSKETRTSDDYRAKQGAKALGGIALSFIMGQNPYQTTMQSYVMKRNYRQGIKIDKEFYCKHCGYKWKPEPTIPQPKQTQSSESSFASPKPALLMNTSAQVGNKNEVQELNELLDAGILTHEEFDREMNRLNGTSISHEVPSAKPKTLKEKVQDLRDLKDAGTLTQEEFDSEMNKLLLS